jgi:hypothetical protein
MGKKISGELNITDERANQIMRICEKELVAKDTIHEILQAFICSDFDTKELVFASYCLGATRMELMSKTDFNEMRKMVEILERFEKLSK